MEPRTNQHPGAGLAGRMVRTFTAPGETFASVRERSAWLDWFAPTLIVAAADVADLAARVPTWTMDAWSDVWPAFLTSAANPFLTLFIAGGVLLLVANFILGGGATYGRMLAVAAYASLVTVAGRIATGLLFLVTGTRVDIKPGLLLPDEILDTLAGLFLAGVDLFGLWHVLLTAIGTGVMAGCSTRRALVPVLILWAVRSILQLAALSALHASMGR